jgi:hypothetical protein
LVDFACARGLAGDFVHDVCVLEEEDGQALEDAGEAGLPDRGAVGLEGIVG